MLKIIELDSPVTSISERSVFSFMFRAGFLKSGFYNTIIRRERMGKLMGGKVLSLPSDKLREAEALGVPQNEKKKYLERI